MIVLSYLPAPVLFAGLVLLTAYKHYAWIKLLSDGQSAAQLAKDAG